MEPSLDDGWQTLDESGRDFLAQALSEIGDAAASSSPTNAPRPERADARTSDGTPAPSALFDMLRLAVAAGASDLHLCAGLPPHLRVSGELGPIADHPPLSAANLEASLHAALTSEQRRELDATGDLELGLTLNGFRTETGVGAPDVSAQPDREVRRFRASMFRHSGTLAAAIRLVPHRIPNLAALGLPSVAAELAERPSGLVLVTGPTGSGKSTTLASMVEAVNQGRAAHILTIEDPIEYRYTPARSIIQQREVGADTTSFAEALRQGLRQDPDVILIGELRDLETIRIALTAAETGHLVFATLHSADVTSAVNRIIDVFPAEQQAQIRSQLALSIQGCLSQRLLPAVDAGLVPATEVLVATAAVRSLIRDSKLHQLRSILETGAEVGMHTFDQSLAALVRAGRLPPTVAKATATDPTNLAALVQS